MRTVDVGRVLLPLIHTLTGTASPPPHTGNSRIPEIVTDEIAGANTEGIRPGAEHEKPLGQ
jgi:hypothetical protein